MNKETQKNREASGSRTRGPTGKCPHCKGTYALSAGGDLRLHSVGGRGSASCPGSYGPPA